MDSENIDHHFHCIGSRFVTRDLSEPKLTARSRAPFSINIDTDKRGREFFRFAHRVPVELQVLDTHPGQRHLLIAVSGGNITRTFLCGHDERHYFAPGVDEPVRNITDAMITLQPDPVREAARPCPPMNASPAQTAPSSARASGSSCAHEESAWIREILAEVGF